MANCAAPETMITDEKNGEPGRKPGPDRQHAVCRAEPGDSEDDEAGFP